MSREDAGRARRENIGLREGMTEMPTVARDMWVADSRPLSYDAPTPLAVVDNGRLLGVIIRGRILEALSETEVQ